jgi:plasmid stabilization system protein ParE
MGEEIAVRFIEVMNHKVRQIAINPFIGKAAGKGNNVRSFVVTKHNKLYYRLIGEEVIEIAALFDTRQNPVKNRFE